MNCKQIILIILCVMAGSHFLFAQTEGNDAESESEVEQVEKEPRREISAERWATYQKDKDFIYRPVTKKKEAKKQHTPSVNLHPFFSSRILLGFLIFMVILVILFIGYKMVSNSEFNYFRKQKGQDQPLDNEVKDPLTQWEHDLQAALLIPDFRLAYRILYIELLHTLRRSGKISFAEEKTNWDYVHSLVGTALHDEFSVFTRYFDYIWYGQFEPNEPTYQQLAKNLNDFKAQIIKT